MHICCARRIESFACLLAMDLSDRRLCLRGLMVIEGLTNHYLSSLRASSIIASSRMRKKLYSHVRTHSIKQHREKTMNIN